MTYAFATLAVWKGARPPFMGVGAAELGCRFGGDVEVGERFVVTLGVADEESGGAVWEVRGDGTLEDGTLDVQAQTLDELDQRLRRELGGAEARPPIDPAIAAMLSGVSRVLAPIGVLIVLGRLLLIAALRL